MCTVQYTLFVSTLRCRLLSKPLSRIAFTQSPLSLSLSFFPSSSIVYLCRLLYYVYIRSVWDPSPNKIEGERPKSMGWMKKGKKESNGRTTSPRNLLALPSLPNPPLLLFFFHNYTTGMEGRQTLPKKKKRFFMPHTIPKTLVGTVFGIIRRILFIMSFVLYNEYEEKCLLCPVPRLVLALEFLEYRWRTFTLVVHPAVMHAASSNFSKQEGGGR